MNELLIHKTTTSDYMIRTKTYKGRNHLVVPVVMMVEGVHSGSKGPIFHSIKELGKFPEAWNGIPVTIGHPKKDGQYISANEPEIAERAVGKIFHTKVDGNKLKAEAWIDVENIENTSPLAIAYIRQGRKLEVSVGVFTDEDHEEGEWNGETYQAIAKNHRPDHLALLPGEQGACSWEDGCGIRTNQSVSTKHSLNEMNEEEKTLKELAGKGFQIGLMANAVGFQEVLEKLQRKLNAMDNDQLYHYVQEVYPDYLVYTKVVRNQGDSEFLKQSYQINADGTIELVGEPTKVRKEISFVQVNKVTTNKERESHMDDKKKTTCFLAKVEKLIAHEATGFTDSDKEWLLGQEESILDKLMPKEISTNQETVQVNAEQAREVLRETLKKPEDFLALMPEEMRDQMRSGLALHQSHRTNLIQNIITNGVKGVWTEDELKKMDTQMLEKISKSVQAPADYSLNGGVGAVPVEQEMLLPSGVKTK